MKQKTILFLVLAGWCLLFLRCETTEKSMVRALYLSRQERGWEAALLYQAPEAAADASKATAALRVGTGKGGDLAAALSAAEESLPQTADYRLCDYLLFPEDSDRTTLADYETLVLKDQRGRTAARMICTDFDLEELRMAAEKTGDLPDKLLDKLKGSAGLLPRLYQRQETILLPVLEIADTGFALKDREQMWTADGNKIQLEEPRIVMFRLLSGTGGVHCFRLEGRQLNIRRCSVSVTMTKSLVRLRLDCQNEYGRALPGEENCRQLEQLCEDTVRQLWGQQVDVLHLQQASSLRYGRQGMLSPTKNACPRLEADVHFY